MIECVTMRMRGHSEHDDASYVPAELLAEWNRKDPVERFERWLLHGAIMGSDTRDRIREEIARQVTEAADWADQQPLPDPSSAHDTVFSHEL